MIRRQSPPRAKVITAVTGAATAVLGLAGVVGVMTLGATGSHRAVAPLTVRPAAGTASPYFVCLAYGTQYGICIGPPTN